MNSELEAIKDLHMRRLIEDALWPELPPGSPDYPTRRAMADRVVEALKKAGYSRRIRRSKKGNAR